MDTCGICKYWITEDEVRKEKSGINFAGFCRRYPPKEYRQMAGDVRKSWEESSEFNYIRHIECFPTTASSDWCGEFKSK